MNKPSRVLLFSVWSENVEGEATIHHQRFRRGGDGGRLQRVEEEGGKRCGELETTCDSKVQGQVQLPRNRLIISAKPRRGMEKEARWRTGEGTCCSDGNLACESGAWSCSPNWLLRANHTRLHTSSKQELLHPSAGSSTLETLSTSDRQ